MSEPWIKKEVTINATPSTVWRMFTDPAFTRQMGGEYISDWESGSTINWKNIDGQILTHGKILKIEPYKLLQHSLYNPEKPESVMAIITYELLAHGDGTAVLVRQHFTDPVDEEVLSGYEEGWDVALGMIKGLLEK